jgi:PAS domain S-box-containing protein
MLIPDRYRGRHLGHRTAYIQKPKTRAMGAGLELYGLRKDGIEFPIDISLSPLNTEEGVMVTAAIRDITERKKVEEALQRSADHLRLVIDTIPGLVWSALPNGHVDFVNQRWREYTGLRLDQAIGWGWRTAFHPEDLPGLEGYWLSLVASGKAGKTVARFRRFDGVYRWALFLGVPLHDETGKLVKWYGQTIDIDDRKRAEEELRRSEFYLAEGQRLAHIGSWSFTADGMREYWSAEWFNILGLDPARGVPPIPEWLNIVHPHDRERVKSVIERMIEKGEGCDEKYRILHPHRGVRWIRGVGMPVFENGVLTRFAGTSMDITEEEMLTQELIRSRGYLAQAQRVSQTGRFGWVVRTGEIFWSEETFRIFEYDPATCPKIDLVIQRVHPDDRAFVRKVIERTSEDGSDIDIEHRLLMPDGSVKHVHVVAHASQFESGQLEFVGAVSDVTAAKRAQERIRQNEREFRQIVEAIPGLILVLTPDGRPLYANGMLLEYTGLTLEDVQADNFYDRVFHPDDLERLRDERHQALLRGVPFELVQRARGKDGQYRWFLTRFNPVRDEQGHVVRWYATGTDIEDRKQAEERLKHENVALREEIDKTSMFEEIVGASPALKAVLARIAKVAPTDSAVLITGETGTGKELAARAIHKRSKRSSRPFVSVNCASIPAPLIASELFGHEKGAFTGALKRRLGRFEMADGGTIFLDEIGELPGETQIALLHVLQEHEFERVGGNQTIRTNVRVISATNRDLKAAIEAGTFRSDLFYRLNVFPIEIPPLRERKKDIPILVQYFIDRYARKAGKKIRSIDKKSLELLQSYPWPGNIRELQNVIERSVIVCDTESFSIDESWLSRESRQTEPASQSLADKLVTQEKEMIEAALAECKGRVSGPSGAAAKLGIPHTTLESKIRSLKINKQRFKPASHLQ